jgi:glutathione synthase/RimK-type ligase-like ATP-grasp enzyme
MANVYVVLDDEADWLPYYPSSNVISFEGYLESTYGRDKQILIINLCRHYKYLTKGYYTSLLAEARGHKVIPSVKAINDISRKSIYGLQTDELDAAFDKQLKKSKQVLGAGFSLLICFGYTAEQEFAEIGRKIFEVFPFPLLNVQFEFSKTWQIVSIKSGSIKNLNDVGEDLFAASLDKFNSRIWRKPRSKKTYRYDLAILVNPEEKLPPSNKKAIENFIKAAKRYDMFAETVTKRDFSRLGEYDALFIRETTAINHHTYTFARKAESEGLVVIDDPSSIVRCANKVFLHETLLASKLKTPKTLVLQVGQELNGHVAEYLGFPIVLKIPDGSFSKGVFMVKSEEELKEKCKELFQTSVLVLAQEFMYTPFDWRVGVFNKKALFVCKYFMSKGHWQIYRHGVSRTECGAFQTMSVQQAPKAVVNAALKATASIGDSIYGVDIKQKDDDAYIIEVNDNPNIDAGLEDGFLGDVLYDRIIEEFSRRLNGGR